MCICTHRSHFLFLLVGSFLVQKLAATTVPRITNMESVSALLGSAFFPSMLPCIVSTGVCSYTLVCNSVVTRVARHFNCCECNDWDNVLSTVFSETASSGNFGTSFTNLWQTQARALHLKDLPGQRSPRTMETHAPTSRFHSFLIYASDIVDVIDPSVSIRLFVGNVWK